MRKILFVVVVGLVLALVTYSPAQDGKNKDIDYLMKLYGPNNVTITLTYNPTPVKGQITGGRVLFGRQFLQLSSDSGVITLVDVGSIAAIRQSP